MDILGYHISREGVLVSSGDSCDSLGNCLEFLLKSRSDTIRLLYSVDYSLAFALLQLHLSQDEYKYLEETTKLSVPPYHLRYVPGKLFSIKRTGAFSYFADSQQYLNYPISDLENSGLSLALRAESTGRRVYQILTELGIETTSLVSPARAYEKSQISKLYKETVASSDDEVRSSIIEGIGMGVFGDRWTKYLQVH